MSSPEVHCGKCGKSAAFNESITSRPLESEPGITEHGIRCPHCQNFVHGYFMSSSLEKKRAYLKRLRAVKQKSQAQLNDYQRLQETYRKEYAALHARLYQKLNMRPLRIVPR